MWHYVKYNLQRGIALLIVLLFLQIFALLGLYALENTVLAEKISRLHWHEQVTLATAENILEDIEKRLQADQMSCMIPATGSQDLLNRSFSEWPSLSTCTGNFHNLQYYYAVESLGQDPCATIGYTNKIADYYRITLITLAKAADTKIMLQGTMVKPVKNEHECRGISHSVSIGLQAWHEI